MISLFGKEEFDPPGPRSIDPWTALKLSGIWVLLSLLSIGLRVEQVSHFRSSGRPVSVWDKAMVWLWVVMLLFSVWNGWKSFRKYRAERKIV